MAFSQGKHEIKITFNDLSLTIKKNILIQVLISHYDGSLHLDTMITYSKWDGDTEDIRNQRDGHANKIYIWVDFRGIRK